jgi:hypothetical protein
MRVHWRSSDWKNLILHLPQAAVRLWGRCRALLPADGYRPEQYYMRGPGPKTLSRQSSHAGDQKA